MGEQISIPDIFSSSPRYKKFSIKNNRLVTRGDKKRGRSLTSEEGGWVVWVRYTVTKVHRIDE